MKINFSFFFRRKCDNARVFLSVSRVASMAYCFSTDFLGIVQFEVISRDEYSQFRLLGIDLSIANVPIMYFYFGSDGILLDRNRAYA